MTLFLSLQGPMAVGKTTALKYLEANCLAVTVSYEENREVIAEIKARDLNKNTFQDYIEIQRLFIQNELDRYAKYQDEACVVMDFGAEEIYFYTLNDPLSRGYDWPVAEALKEELAQLTAILPKHILYLQTSPENLRRNKENDQDRDRGFFETYVTRLLPLKERWFANSDQVDFLNVDGLSKDEMGRKVQDWVKGLMKQTNSN